jgi:hypothetical protein
MGIRLDLVGYVIGAVVRRHVAASRMPYDQTRLSLCNGIDAE